MNNTKTLAIVAIFMAATLVVGTFAATATTQTALAYQKKNRGGSQENSRDGNTVTLQACKQDATESGFDNSLAQECQNVICTHPGNNATCVQEGAATTKTPPVKLTCEQCIRNHLNDAQIKVLLGIANKATLGEVCDILHTGTQHDIQDLFISILGPNLPGSEAEAALIIQCLLDAGIVFKTP
jgi:hypothetical protein